MKSTLTYVGKKTSKLLTQGGGKPASLSRSQTPTTTLSTSEEATRTSTSPRVSASSPTTPQLAREAFSSRNESFFVPTDPSSPHRRAGSLSLSSSRGSPGGRAGKTPPAVGAATGQAHPPEAAPSSAQRALMQGDPPLIQAIGEGAAVSFHVQPLADLPPWEHKIVQLALEWIDQGRLFEAIRLLQAVASAVDDPALRRRLLGHVKHCEPRIIEVCQRCFLDDRAEDAVQLLDAAMSTANNHHFPLNLLKALTPQFTLLAQHPSNLKDCQGIGRAIRLLAERGWWSPAQPCCLARPVRQALLALSDWDSAAAVLTHEVNERIEQLAQQPGPDDIEPLLDGLDALFRGARERQDRSLMQRVLGWTQYLVSHGLGAGLDAHTWLRERHERLNRDCLNALRHRGHAVRINPQLTLSLEAPSGEWSVTEHHHAGGRKPKDTAQAQATFIADVDRLLEDPEGPPWPLLNELIAQACRAGDWVAEDMPWLRWCILEAGRQQTAPLEHCVLELQKKLDAEGADSLSIAQDRFFDGLVGLVRRQLPWPRLQQAMDAVHASSGWRLRPSQRLSLCLALAERGEPLALIDLLQQGFPAEFADDQQRRALLALCDQDHLGIDARAQLLRHAQALFIDGSPLQREYQALVSWRSVVSPRLQRPEANSPVRLARRGRGGSGPPTDTPVADLSKPNIQ